MKRRYSGHEAPGKYRPLRSFTRMRRTLRSLCDHGPQSGAANAQWSWSDSMVGKGKARVGISSTTNNLWIYNQRPLVVGAAWKKPKYSKPLGHQGDVTQFSPSLEGFSGSAFGTARYSTVSGVDRLIGTSGSGHGGQPWPRSRPTSRVNRHDRFRDSDILRKGVREGPRSSKSKCRILDYGLSNSLFGPR